MDRRDPVLQNLLAYSEELNRKAERKKLEDRVLLGTFAGPLLGAALAARTGQDIARAITLPTRALKGEISPEAVDLETGETGPNPRMTEEAMNAAGALGGTGALVPKPANSLGIFGGKSGAYNYVMRELKDLEQELGRPARKAEFEARMESAPKHMKTYGFMDEKKNVAKLDELEATHSPQQILEQTGWFRDPADGHWKFEIADNEAAVNFDNLKTQGASLKDVYEHPELYKYYPQLGEKITVKHAPDMHGGLFNRVTNEMKIGKDYPEWEVLTHEAQHGVQRAEGHPRGGSVVIPKTVWDKAELPRPDTVGRTLYPQQLLQKLKSRELMAKEFGTDPRPEYLEAKAELAKLEPVLKEKLAMLEKTGTRMNAYNLGDELLDLELKRSELLGKMDYYDTRPLSPEELVTKQKLQRYADLYNEMDSRRKTDAFHMYENIPGERVARNAQKRVSMTPEERVAIPPWSTLDPIHSMLLKESYAPDLETAMKNLLTKGDR